MKKILMGFAVLSALLLSGCEVVNNITNYETEELTTAVSAVVDNVDDGVVGVLAGENGTSSTGSGSIVSKTGNTYTVLTNNHVITDDNDIILSDFKILTSDDKYHNATYKKRNSADDMAVLTFDSTNDYTVLKFASDEYSYQRGEFVVAMGSPLGFNFRNTVTFGVIGQIDVDMSSPSYGGIKSPMIQHDAAINSGNSGGPLFNLNSEIIGMNTSKIDKASNGSVVIGMYFAVSSETIQDYL